MKKILTLSLSLLLVLVGACTKKEQRANEVSLRFFLTDLPGIVQEVNVDLQGLAVIINDSLIGLPVNQGVYNVLDFTNGKDTLLADASVPAGYLSQVRLILGENNSIMVDSVVHDLKTPSAQTSGLKLNVHNELVPGENYSYIIDFDARRSLVKTGNSKYILKPVIRVFTEVLSGSLKGIVQPVYPDLLVQVAGDNDTLSSNTDTAGYFMFRGLYAGMYDLLVGSATEGIDTTLSDIQVLAGQTTVLDTVFLAK